MNTSWSLKTILRFLALEISPPVVDIIHTYIRKAVHFTEYFILSLLLFRAFRGGSRTLLDWRWFFFATSLGVLWAAMDEFHQSFVPTRTGSLGESQPIM
jgi:VanZ family protein